MKPVRHVHAKAGFTLIEVIFATTIFGVIGVGLTQGIQIAETTHQSVSSEGGHNREMRNSIGLLRDEFKACRDSSIDVQTTPDGNHRLVFQVPVDSGVGTGWGVYDRKLGSGADDWNRVGWNFCYLVSENNQGQSCLVRQILDGGGALQRETEIVRHVLANDPSGIPGFTVVSTGDVWEFTLTTQTDAAHAARTETFQIQTRN
ncbi:MAG: prepilin-type N-terminal cleavage/methylation domain-containing protein [Glaciecola sp.]|jgi:prepilin-type N-terminal cleavage/methylation domain-containing protein